MQNQLHKKLIGIVFSLVIAFFIIPISPSFARDYITDWYLKDYKSVFELKNDSTMIVTEYLTADCGDLPDKHGVFRVLPTRARRLNETIKTPLRLISITDFDDNPLPYSEYSDFFHHTITWKIGDPDVAVTGENQYKIKYEYKNIINFENSDFDEFYWNLSGNFWDIEIDNYTGMIIFPDKVTSKNTDVSYFTGRLGSIDKSLGVYSWNQSENLVFSSTKMFHIGEGITTSVIFPKNIFNEYELTFADKYQSYIPYVIYSLFPFLSIILMIIFWLRYGKDKPITKTTMPEYSIPDDLNPMTALVLMNGGAYKKEAITSGVISLATKGALLIKDIRIGLFKTKSFEFTKIENSKTVPTLDPSEKLLLDTIFSYDPTTVKLSEVASIFKSERENIKKQIMKDLIEKDFITKDGYKYHIVFYTIGFLIASYGIIFPFITFYYNIKCLSDGSIMTLLSVLFFVIALFMMYFAQYMNKMTEKGRDTVWRLKNLKMYMTTAEIHRQRFYEEQNIFEKFLPYAIAFGITKLWIKRIGDLFGEEFFMQYHPTWYASFKSSSFSISSFNSAMNSLSSNISSSMGSNVSSSSGGGGGGGGGGGW